MNLIERILPILRTVPRPLLPLVPLWIFGGTFSVLLAAFAVLVVHLNSTHYHLTAWTGQPILSTIGDRHRAGDIAQSKTAQGRDNSDGNAESRAPTRIAAHTALTGMARVERRER
jgi:hypothetical protein